ncbi:MAG: 2-hydroxyacyl-CoA dehydratase family protein [Candidatus Marinimicrobia bacterium]|jgi:benzoyl-CoA reductase subunit B|nr:2-hydroxyacyl-CoA dehydratase family protein [Candidatus Neomarinimicrobiota bacterium]
MNEIKNIDMVGRGTREGAALFRDWFQDLTEKAEKGETAAYVFVMGSIAEILRVFDLPMVFPEIHSLQTAVRHVADDYINVAEDYGYSPDICGYVKADFAMQMQNGKHPMGQIPKPGIAVLTNACNTYLKWGEIWERIYDIPMVSIDVPATREAGTRTWPGDEQFEREKRYVKTQLKELIELCEKMTGKKFDIDKLREILGHVNTMSTGWKRVMELNQSRPSLFNALTDGTVYLGMSNVFRGTPEGADFFTRLVEEMEYMSANGIGTLTDEKYRLSFIGVPCYPIFRRFNEMFTEWGGAFVMSTYLWFASGGTNLGVQYDLDNPMDSLAEGVLISVRDAMDSMFHPELTVLDKTNDYNIDGVVYHPIKSCRTTSAGMADNRRALMENSNLPSLFIESDMMDSRVVGEAQMKNRIDAFFEGLASRKAKEAIGA